MNEIEKNMSYVFGEAFSKYSAKEFKDSIDFFVKRWKINSLEPKDLFTNKICLDAGCGNGRGAAFMLMNGAAWVHCVDISRQNIISTTENLKQLGFSNYSFWKKNLNNLEEIYEPESFDFVWCNGVINHVEHVDEVLKQITNVLKPGGFLWLYAYGKGGLYWYMINFFRQWLKDIPKEKAFLELSKVYPPLKVAEFLDDWYVSILETFSMEEFRHIFSPRDWFMIRLNLGVNYDTCMRKIIFPSDLPYMGEGDIRLLLQKYNNNSTTNPITKLPYEENELISNFKETFDSLNAIDVNDRLLIAAKIQIYIRETFNKNQPFNPIEFKDFMREFHG